MLTNAGHCEGAEAAFKAVAEAAWEVQAKHERFLFKKGRPEGHPSRVAWVNANNLWFAEVKARKAVRASATRH